MVPAPQLLFHEEQRFRQPWIWAVILIIVGIMLWGVIQQLILGKPFGDNPAPDYLLLIFLVIFGFALPWFIYSLKLTVDVFPDHIYIRYFPLHKRRIAFHDIKKCYARQYRPIREYGGWGMRWSPWSGYAYNVSGNMGVQFELSDGRKLLIGSLRADELAHIIEKSRPGRFKA